MHVLLVCDDVERCELFAHALTYAGALVTQSVSADAARAVLDRVRPNVLVVELRNADARARLITDVRALPAELGGKMPALALTGSHEDSEALLAAGYQLHVVMPLRAAELCGAVASLSRQPAAWPRL